MTLRRELIDRFRGDQAAAALVRVETARGSTPREAGSWMVVGPSAAIGTIGGGQLEYMAIDAARALLAKGGDRTTLDVPLGPEIGQCCGGRTMLSVARLDTDGWGRVHAIAAARCALPESMSSAPGTSARLAAALVCCRSARAGRPARGRTALAPKNIDAAPRHCPRRRSGPHPGSAVVLTHDHALDS
ncbi:MAG: XdhC family protein [Amaricoccus sp.]